MIDDDLNRWPAMMPSPDFAERVVDTWTRRARMRRIALGAGAVTALAAAAAVLFLALQPSAKTFAHSNQSELLSHAPAVAPAETNPPAPVTNPPAPVTNPPIDPVLELDTPWRPGEVQVPIGATLTIHDRNGKSIVKFVDDGTCQGHVHVQVSVTPSFRAGEVFAVGDKGTFDMKAGTQSYRVRCEKDGPVVAAGQIVLRTDSGQRPLPSTPPINPIDLDGRNYQVFYQREVPRVSVRFGGDPAKQYRLHIEAPGHDQTLESTSPTVIMDGLVDGTYKLTGERDGTTDTKSTTLIISFDQTAPQVYIAPDSASDDSVRLKGAVLPGWELSINGSKVPIVKGRFSVKVPRRDVIVLRASHPQRGVHLYVRRVRH